MCSRAMRRACGVPMASELEVLRQRRALVTLSADLQRATLTRRLGRIESNPGRILLGAAAKAVKKPLVWRLGATTVAFAVSAFRKRSARRRGRAH